MLEKERFLQSGGGGSRRSEYVLTAAAKLQKMILIPGYIKGPINFCQLPLTSCWFIIKMSSI